MRGRHPGPAMFPNRSGDVPQTGRATILKRVRRRYRIARRPCPESGPGRVQNLGSAVIRIWTRPCRESRPGTGAYTGGGAKLQRPKHAPKHAHPGSGGRNKKEPGGHALKVALRAACCSVMGCPGLNVDAMEGTFAGQSPKLRFAPLKPCGTIN